MQTRIFHTASLRNNVIRQARIRILANVAAGAALRNTTGLLSLLAAAALFERTLGLSLPEAWILPAVLLFVVAAAAQLTVNAPGRIAAALKLDRLECTSELFTTAAEMESAGGDIPNEVRTRAEAAACNCDVRRAIPFFVNPVPVVISIVLTAVLLVIPEKSTAPLPAKQFIKETAGSKTNQALNRVRTRLETVRAIANAAAELEALGMPGLKKTIDQGNIEASSAAASAAGDDIDRAAVSNVFDRLRKNAPDRGLRERLTHGGKGKAAKLAGILAEYTAGTNVSDLLTRKESLRAAAAVSGTSSGRPTTGDTSLPPDEIAPGESPIVDFDSVPPRYRLLVKRYFTHLQ